MILVGEASDNSIVISSRESVWATSGGCSLPAMCVTQFFRQLIMVYQMKLKLTNEKYLLSVMMKYQSYSPNNAFLSIHTSSPKQVSNYNIYWPAEH